MCAAQCRRRPTPSSIRHPLCVCCMQEGVITGPTPVVEAGPPRMREVWLQGSTVAGGVLQAGSWYWGGVQGASRYTWIRITADGERIETATRQCDDPTTPLPVRHCVALPCLALPCVVCDSHNAHLSHCAVFGLVCYNRRWMMLQLSMLMPGATVCQPRMLAVSSRWQSSQCVMTAPRYIQCYTDCCCCCWLLP